MHAFHLAIFIQLIILGSSFEAIRARVVADVSSPRFSLKSGQITFEGKRAGEGYFSAADGTKLVFQSERRDDNPFFQIYLLDFETGDVEPISPGQWQDHLRVGSSP